MNIQKWKFFNSRGHQMQMIPDSYINLQFNSPVSGKNATGFLITDPSGLAIGAEITNGGYLYDDNTTVTYTYTFDPNSAVIPLTTGVNIDVSTIDVSVFNPELTNTKSINSLSIIDLSTNFIYPSFTFGGAVFLEPVSVGLVETEQLFILEVSTGSGYIRPYDDVNSSLIIQMVGEEDEIKLFTVDEDTVEVTWADQIVINDLNLYEENTPLTINIGFRAEEEGVFERRLRIYHVVGENYYTLAEIIVNAQSIGEDERFRTLLGNFGLPDPKDFPKLFKETDINEDFPDWEVLNAKSKHMILEHDKIMPYVGTYKALINALKWLGYDDIFVREWFKNVKENTKISLVVPFEAKDRTQTILMFSPEERKALKKLNQLSLNYAINYETGELDDWGTPITANSYAYNLQEIYVKLLALKQWLEKNIIGVNSHIIDITGEGVYFERFQNLIYTTGNVGYNYKINQTLTPYAVEHDSELVHGDASIRLTFSELSKTKISDLPYKFKDLITYLWDPSDLSSKYYEANDSSILLSDPSLLRVIKVGPTFRFPFIHLSDIQWKASTEKTHGVFDTTLVTNPLFIYENEIKFYNVFDTSSVFYDASTSLKITLENAILREISSVNDVWVNAAVYNIYPDPCDNGEYIMKHLSTDTCTRFNSFVSFAPDTSNARLQYAIDTNYRVPLLSFKNFIATDINGSNVSFSGTEYYLDIQNGKISMKHGFINDNFLTSYINFNYDASLSEQKINMNVVYESPREQLFQFDPSAYYWADPSGHAGSIDPSVVTIDNSIHTMHVNHIGDYTLELFGWDGYNTLLYNTAKDFYPVWIKNPTIYILNDSSILLSSVKCASTFMSLNDVSILIANNQYPIYDRHIPLQGLTLEYDANNNPYIKVPSITYFQDVPVTNSINKFFNLTERITDISGNIITVDTDFQKFYVEDNIRIVKFDKGKYSLIAEVSSYILDASGAVNARTLTLDNIPTEILKDVSSDLYIINNTYRSVLNAANSITTSTIDVSGYVFEEGQLIGLIVTDNCTGYSWGSSYRINNVNGTTHTLDNLLPYQFLTDTSKYSMQVKHSFSTYASFTINTSSAQEIDNCFNIYLKNDYNQQYFLDNTFVLINILFDQDKVNSQWYNASDNLITSSFYYYSKPITIDASTLIILRAEFDNSTYMLNQKNIWTVKDSFTKDILLKVYNESVPYIFDVSGYYDIQVESYDVYGNLSSKYYEGLINVI